MKGVVEEKEKEERRNYGSRELRHLISTYLTIFRTSLYDLEMYFTRYLFTCLKLS